MFDATYKTADELDLALTDEFDRQLAVDTSPTANEDLELDLANEVKASAIMQSQLQTGAEGGSEPAQDEVVSDDESIGEDTYLSSRVLMVQGQQIMCQELQTEIRNGAAWLSGLEERSRLINGYLASAEVEFSKLEAQARMNEDLLVELEDLRTQHAAALATIEEQKGALELLNTAKEEFNTQMGVVRSENVRLQEFKKVQLVESGRHKALLVRGENANLKLQEKITLLENEKAKLVQTKIDLENQLSETAINVTEANKASSALTARIKELEGTVEHRSEDLQSVREQYSKLKSKFNEWQVSQKDRSYESDMKKRELEQLLRLKEKRIAELEGLQSESNLQQEITAEKSDDDEEKAATSKRKTSKNAAKPRNKAA